MSAEKKSATVTSFEDEELLWKSCVLGFDTPRSLLIEVFFYVGLHFCLCGGQEQRDLSFKQFARVSKDTGFYNEDTYYEYTEFISKNNQHRFKGIHAKSKTVKTYAVIESDKCLVKILDCYVNKVPQESKAF